MSLTRSSFFSAASRVAAHRDGSIRKFTVFLVSGMPRTYTQSYPHRKGDFMALVTGTFVDSAGQPLPAALTPEVRAIPSKPTITVAGKTITTREQTVSPSATTGAYTLDLEPTANALGGDFHYKIRGSFKMPNGYNDGSGYTRVDVFEYRLEVPTAGGTVGDLVGKQVGNSLVYVGTDAPRDDQFTEFQFNPVTGDLYRQS